MFGLQAGALRRLECAFEREQSAGARRRRPEEPREERELLRVIRESAFMDDERRTRQRISDFEIVLTAADLPDMSPSRSRVVDERIIRPLADLVRICVDVLDTAVEENS